MPCRDEYAERDSYNELIRKVDTLTRVACDLRTILRRKGTEDDLAPETKSWIAQHDDWDTRRIAEETAKGDREQFRREALAKLNLDERRVLGL